MKRILIICIVCACVAAAFAQTTGGAATGSSTGSAAGKGGISDGQVVKSAVSQKRAGASEAQIASSLLQQGATPQQLQRLRNQYADQINKAGAANAVDNGLKTALDNTRKNVESADNPTAQLDDNADLAADDAEGDVEGDDTEGLRGRRIQQPPIDVCAEHEYPHAPELRRRSWRRAGH